MRQLFAEGGREKEREGMGISHNLITGEETAVRANLSQNVIQGQGRAIT